MSATLSPEEKAALTFARIEQDRKSARPRREFIREALRNGSRPEYVAMRYGLPLDDILKAKRIWDAEAARDAAVANRHIASLRNGEQSEAQTPVGNPTIAGDGV